MPKAKQELLKSRPAKSNQGVRANIMESDGSTNAEIMVAHQWEDVETEVALDSGSQDHVCDLIDCLGYSLEASPASQRGGCFIVGNSAPF